MVIKAVMVRVTPGQVKRAESAIKHSDEVQEETRRLMRRMERTAMTR